MNDNQLLEFRQALIALFRAIGDIYMPKIKQQKPTA
jgi:hypothetical protein